MPSDANQKPSSSKSASNTSGSAKPSAFMRAMTPSVALSAIVGESPLPRSEVTKKIWAYIKARGLQDAGNRRMINADEKLKAVFDGKSQVSMFEMTKLLNAHLS